MNDLDLVEIGISFVFIVAFFSIIQHAVLKGEWLVHGSAALGATMVFLYYFILAFNLPGIDANIAFREILNRPGLVIFALGVSLILLNGQLKQWTRQLSLRRSSSS